MARGQPPSTPRTVARNHRSAAVDEQAARRAGELLAATGTVDIVDALLAMLVAPGDQLLTSDPGDLSTLLDARNVRATIVRV